MIETTTTNLRCEERRFGRLTEPVANANPADAYDANANVPDILPAQHDHRPTAAHRWDRVLEWSSQPFTTWCVRGRLSEPSNCAERRVEARHGDEVAIHSSGEPERDPYDLIYAGLKVEVTDIANAGSPATYVDASPNVETACHAVPTYSVSTTRWRRPRGAGYRAIRVWGPPPFDRLNNLCEPMPGAYTS